jgi:phospholipid/cholesterol/gamma-HCH transport system substrate-binding protein
VKLSKEVKIGLTVLVALACFIYGFNFLKGKNILKPRNNYYAIYDRIDGLVLANPVQIKGYTIGQVNEISFHPDNSGRLLVNFMIKDNDLKIPKNTVAKIFSTGPLSGQAVEFVLGDSKEYANSGDTLQSGISGGLMEQFGPTKQKVENLLSSIDSTLKIVHVVINKDALKSIDIAIKSFGNTAQNIDGLMAEQRKRLGEIIKNVESISGNFVKNNEQLNHIINNFSSLSDSLLKANVATTVINANKAMKETSDIMAKINQGKGSMGMLINNDSLYVNLNKASKDLDLLFEDMRKRPKRYVHFSIFGGKKDK